MTGLKFTEDFPRPTYEEWKAEAEAALKGAPFDKKMFTKTYENITLRPIYTRQDWPSDGDPSGFPGAMPFTRGGRASGNRAMSWDIRQLYCEPDPKDANDIILRELERGVTSVLVRFDRAGRAGLDGDAPAAAELAGQDGMMIYSVDDLDLTLTGVEMDLISVMLQAGAHGVAAAGLLIALWQRRGLAATVCRGAFNVDPIGTLATDGTLPVALDAALAQAAALAKYTASTYPNVTTFGIDTAPYHTAGANEAQDLAVMLATGVAYLKAMTTAGLDIDQACRQVTASLPVGCDQFLGICKLRAARKLWARIAEACGASEPARALSLHATTAERMMSECDPWVNMLRTTVSCFAAAAGGADSITVLPYTYTLGLPDEVARRVARNTQIVLAEESNLSKVIDAGGGSWYIETRTDELARAAWGEFQAIEASGGIVAALRDGSLAGKIAAVWTEREKALAKRKDPVTGVSEFPNIGERAAEVRRPDLAAAAAGAASRLSAVRAKAVSTAAITDTSDIAALTTALSAGATLGTAAQAATTGAAADTVTPLPRHRNAEAFEALRMASDAWKDKTGSRPRIFLANLGPIAKHTARATFAKNFFEVGGIETVPNAGFKDAESCAKAYKDSGADLAILCSADPLYEEMVASVAPALKAAGCPYLFLAGSPGEHKDAYMKAGVDDFIFLGCDVLQTLRTTLSRLGVIEQ